MSGLTKSSKDALLGIFSDLVEKKIKEIRNSSVYQKKMAEIQETALVNLLGEDLAKEVESLRLLNSEVLSLQQKLSDRKEALRGALRGLKHIKEFTTYIYPNTVLDTVEDAERAYLERQADTVVKASKIEGYKSFLKNIEATILMATSETKLTHLLQRMYQRLGDEGEKEYIEILLEIFPEILE